MPERRAKTPCQRQGACAEDPEGIADVKQRMFRPLRIVEELGHAAVDANIAGARKASEQHRDPIRDVIRDVVAQADCSTRFYGVDREVVTQYNLVLKSGTVAPENAAT